MRITDINGNERECVRISPDKNWPGYMKIEYLSKLRKDYQHAEWYPVKDFIKNNPQLKHLATAAPKPTPEILGIVSRAGKFTLADKTKNWKKNCFTGSPIWISRGKGEAQVRKVVSNSKNTITINRQWETIPNKTSQYIVSYNIHDPKIFGNTLPGMKNK